MITEFFFLAGGWVGGGESGGLPLTVVIHRQLILNV